MDGIMKGLTVLLLLLLGEIWVPLWFLIPFLETVTV